jgi:hypothetical protein
MRRRQDCDRRMHRPPKGGRTCLCIAEHDRPVPMHGPSATEVGWRSTYRCPIAAAAAVPMAMCAETVARHSLADPNKLPASCLHRAGTKACFNLCHLCWPIQQPSSNPRELFRCQACRGPLHNNSGRPALRVSAHCIPLAPAGGGRGRLARRAPTRLRALSALMLRRPQRSRQGSLSSTRTSC